MREICTLGAMWRGLETGLRQLLNGHEEGNLGHSQGEAYGAPRQSSTLGLEAANERVVQGRSNEPP